MHTGILLYMGYFGCLVIFGEHVTALSEKPYLEVYASAMDPAADIPVRYYRDDSGLEVDAIVELADGRWAAFEIKTSEVKVPEAVGNLKRLRGKLCSRPGARTRPPEFMAVITGVSTMARQVEEGIYAVPICALRE